MKRTKVAGGYRALEGDIVGSADAESLEGLARRRPAESAQVLHYGAAHSGLEGAHTAAEHGGVKVSAEDMAVVVVVRVVVVSDEYTAVIDDAEPNARLPCPSHAHAEVRRLVSQSALAPDPAFAPSLARSIPPPAHAARPPNFVCRSNFRSFSLDASDYRYSTNRYTVNTVAMPNATKSNKPAGKVGRSAIEDVVAREYTIHMHKRVRSV